MGALFINYIINMFGCDKNQGTGFQSEPNINIYIENEAHDNSKKDDCDCAKKWDKEQTSPKKSKKK
jgi:hypothetical protein